MEGGGAEASAGTLSCGAGAGDAAALRVEEERNRKVQMDFDGSDPWLVTGHRWRAHIRFVSKFKSKENME